ncbi:MAG: hypothetical protein OEQ18_07795, partial [Gammaproteobacteria bacterium]|nr:hypothetical protein [Gammaproteobacteria bacterium]
MAALSVGGATVSAATLLPTAWVKPVVDVVTLPAHAQLSGPAGQTLSISLTPFGGAPASPPECRAGPEYSLATVTTSIPVPVGTQ